MKILFLNFNTVKVSYCSGKNYYNYMFKYSEFIRFHFNKIIYELRSIGVMPSKDIDRMVAFFIS